MQILLQMFVCVANRKGSESKKQRRDFVEEGTVKGRRYKKEDLHFPRSAFVTKKHKGVNDPTLSQCCWGRGEERI